MSDVESKFLSLFDDAMAMIRKHEMPDRKGQLLFEAAMHGVGTWRLIAVTEAAARTLIESDFNAKLVRRAHKVSRRETFIALRDRVPRAQAFAFFTASDVTTLTTRTENGRHGVAHWSAVHPWPESVGNVVRAMGVGFTKPQRSHSWKRSRISRCRREHQTVSRCPSLENPSRRGADSIGSRYLLHLLPESVRLRRPSQQAVVGTHRQ